MCEVDESPEYMGRSPYERLRRQNVNETLTTDRGFGLTFR